MLRYTKIKFLSVLIWASDISHESFWLLSQIIAKDLISDDRTWFFLSSVILFGNQKLFGPTIVSSPLSRPL